MVNLIFKEVDNFNKNLAIELQAAIFPKEKSPNQVIEGVLTGNPKNFIVYKENTPVGIVGYYTDSNIKNHLFINWFGVLNNHRKNGYGTQILDWLINFCKTKDKSYLTAYTEKQANYAAVQLYKKLGFDVRDYKNKEDISKFTKLSIKNDYVVCMYKLKNCEDIAFEELYLRVYDNLLKLQNGEKNDL